MYISIRTQYAQTVYLNFEKNKRLKALFTDDFDIKRIIVALQAESGLTINAENTLLIFDEIQEVPEAVLKFSENGSFTDVRDIHRQILDAYEQDFSKHAPRDIVPRIRMVWNSVPAQLAKENRKFIYGIIKEGARSKDYELAISWLIDCGLLHKICRVTKPSLPLKAYEDRSAFKLFLADIGLLSSMGSIDAKTMLQGNALFTEFKGALTEQYVLQQLNSSDDFIIYYWSAERSTAEVDFVVQYKNLIVPVEVKAEENLQAKSLKVYREKFSPQVSIRSSMADFRKQEWLTNIPLYAISEIRELIDKEI